MRTKTRRSPFWLTLLAAGCFAVMAAPGRAMAQDDPRYWDDRARDDTASDSDDIREIVARISYTSGDTSFSRGDDPDEWQDLDVNVPMSTGDRIYTGESGRLELQLGAGNAARLDARTDLTALNLTQDAKQLSVGGGTASFQILSLGDMETFEVDTPNAAVTFERAGEYRIDVGEEGTTRIGVLRGRATVAAGGGEVVLDPGEEMDVWGVDDPRYDVIPISERDDFDEWVVGREQRVERSRSYEYVSRDIPGCEDLDEYGRWITIPSYGTVWTPTTVAVSWSPYYDGHWTWRDPWGWTWVGNEPWGWAPYHYGRWVFSAGRWYWVPVRATVVRVAYAPALVAFVGGGPGWSVSVGSGYIGWFPLAPVDPFHPWYGRRAVYVPPTQETYVNRVHVTVVNKTTFVNGGFVRTNVVRDATVVREVSRGPVAGGAIPLVPSRGALRVSNRAETVRPARPSHPAKAVVVRQAPPPAPLPFESKTVLIRERRGAPVTPAIEARVAVQESRGPKARVAVRPVTVVPGAVKLTPRGQGAQAKPPRPVPPGQARRASQQEPVKVPRGEEKKSDEKENSGKDKKDVRGNLHGGRGRH
jgi:hypothetical protein